MSLVEIGAAQRAAAGEAECGDGYVVVDDGADTVIAIADGLGHGPEAAAAAQAFCRFVAMHPALPVDQMLREAHRELATTRGVAAAVLRFTATPHQLHFAGVGNIEVRSHCAAPIKPISQTGVIGARLRRVTAQAWPIVAETLLIAFSDGLSRRLEIDGLAHLTPQAQAAALLEKFGHHHDDATCVVMRVRPGSA